MTGINKLVMVGCCFYLLIGCSSVVAATLLPELLSHYGRNYADGGNLLFAQFFGFLLGVLTQPLWIRRFGRIRMLTFTLVFICIGYAIIGLLPPWPVVLLFLPLVGFGSGMIESTVGALIIDAVKERKAVAMSRLEVFYGVGALVMPMLISLLIVIGWWRLAFFATGLSALLLGLIWLRYSSVNSEIVSRGHEQHSAPPAALKYSRLSLAMLTVCVTVFFIYVGLELSIVNYLPSILMETMRVDAAVASLSVSFYWATMVLGRLVCGYLAERFGYKNYLLWCSAGTVVVLIGFVSITNLFGSFAMIMLMGLLMSGLFSIGLIFSNSLFPGRTEQTTSKLIAASGIGGAVLSWLTGRFMEQASISFTLWFIVALSVLLLGLLAVMARMRPEPTYSEGDRLEQGTAG
ncbi:MFS transporter [Paenibacillus piri]|uniref:MFS transporter n=1 Tax=Paenibacillus piri TaxID=2547395 RepID=A0A4R5KZM2_9BACL|nr:MFS transporter [Paenibacillus piri]TDG00696.1 MFS transporter [Paenibacillus piri]